MQHVSSLAMMYINPNYIGFLQEFNILIQVIEFYNDTNNNKQLTFVSDQMYYKFGCTSKYRCLRNVALKIYLGNVTAS